jgi:hypothetical protein
VSNDNIDASDVLSQVSDAKISASNHQRREVAQELLSKRRTVDSNVFVDETPNLLHFVARWSFALFLLSTMF